MTFIWKLAVAFTLLASGAASARRLPIDHVDVSRFPEAGKVRFFVDLVDSVGQTEAVKRLEGLELVVDGEPVPRERRGLVQAQSFRASHEPMALGVLVTHYRGYLSASLDEPSMFDHVRRGAAGVLRDLDGVVDWAGVWSYDEKGLLPVWGLSRDASQAAEALDGMVAIRIQDEEQSPEATRGPAFYDHLLRVVVTMAESNVMPRRKVLLVLTDGLGEYRTSNRAALDRRVAEIAEIANLAGIRLWFVGGVTQEDQFLPYLSQMASLTGGRFVTSGDPLKVENAVRELGTAMGEQSVIDMTLADLPAGASLGLRRGDLEYESPIRLPPGGPRTTPAPAASSSRGLVWGLVGAWLAASVILFVGVVRTSASRRLRIGLSAVSIVFGIATAAALGLGASPMESTAQSVVLDSEPNRLSERAAPNGRLLVQVATSERVTPLVEARLQVTSPLGQSTTGTSSFQDAAAALGTWKVSGSAPGFVEQEQTVELRDGVTRVVRLELVPRPPPIGDLKVTGGPLCSTVTIADSSGVVAEGWTPWIQKRLPAGKYRVAVGAKGHAAFETDVDVVDGKTATVAAPTPPDYGAQLIIADQAFPLGPGIRSRTFRDPDGLSLEAAQKKKASLVRDRPGAHTLDELRRAVTMVVLHTDLSASARDTFKQLVERGLGDHINIEWDGTVYELADLAQVVAHAGGEYNRQSIAITLNSMMPILGTPEGQELLRSGRWPTPEMRARGAADPTVAIPLEPRVGWIQGNKRMSTVGFTEAQYTALTAILRVLNRELGLPIVYPTDGEGVVFPTILEAEDASTFRGILAHWHLSVARWDPGPGFDWKRMHHCARSGGP